jgi:hypothetical protein
MYLGRKEANLLLIIASTISEQPSSFISDLTISVIIPMCPGNFSAPIKDDP